MAPGSRPSTAGRRLEVMPVIEVAQGGLAGIHPQVNGTAAPTIATVRTTSRDMGFLPEGRGTIAAIATADPDLHPVEEHPTHSRTPSRADRENARWLQVEKWVHPRSTVPDGSAPDLEVEVRSGGITRLSDPADLLAPADVLAAPDGDRRHVVVRRVQP